MTDDAAYSARAAAPPLRYRAPRNRAATREPRAASKRRLVLSELLAQPKATLRCMMVSTAGRQAHSAARVRRRSDAQLSSSLWWSKAHTSARSKWWAMCVLRT